MIKHVKAVDKNGNLITGTATIQSLGGVIPATGSTPQVDPPSMGYAEYTVNLGYKPKTIVIHGNAIYGFYCEYIGVNAGVIHFISGSASDNWEASIEILDYGFKLKEASSQQQLPPMNYCVFA